MWKVGDKRRLLIRTPFSVDYYTSRLAPKVLMTKYYSYFLCTLYKAKRPLADDGKQRGNWRTTGARPLRKLVDKQFYCVSSSIQNTTASFNAIWPGAWLLPTCITCTCCDFAVWQVFLLCHSRTSWPYLWLRPAVVCKLWRGPLSSLLCSRALFRELVASPERKGCRGCNRRIPTVSAPCPRLPCVGWPARPWQSHHVEGRTEVIHFSRGKT